MSDTRTIPEVLADRVRELREHRNLSLNKLANRCKELGHTIDASGIMRLENGERRATVEDLTYIALALDVFPVDLLTPVVGDVNMPGVGPRDRRDVKMWFGGRLHLDDPRHKDLVALDAVDLHEILKAVLSRPGHPIGETDESPEMMELLKQAVIENWPASEEVVPEVED